MKIAMLSLLMLFILPSQGLEDIRLSFQKANLNEENAIVFNEMMKQDLSIEKDLHTAYLGASETLLAKFGSSAGEKLKAFKAGKANIEQAVTNKPKNVEIRLIRLIIQNNAPAMLRYSGEMEEDKVELPGFLRLLNLDMQNDLSNYIKTSGDPKLTIKSVADVMAFNEKDSLARMPYGQSLFAGVVADSASDKEFAEIKKTLKTNGRLFFDTAMKNHNLDGVISINNFHASFAAVAEYPAITVPMGYSEVGAPEGLTFISKPFSEKLLLGWAYTYEQDSKRRVPPKDYN